MAPIRNTERHRQLTVHTVAKSCYSLVGCPASKVLTATHGTARWHGRVILLPLRRLLPWLLALLPDSSSGRRGHGQKGAHPSHQTLAHVCSRRRCRRRGGRGAGLASPTSGSGRPLNQQLRAGAQTKLLQRLRGLGICINTVREGCHQLKLGGHPTALRGPKKGRVRGLAVAGHTEPARTPSGRGVRQHLPLPPPQTRRPDTHRLETPALAGCCGRGSERRACMSLSAATKALSARAPRHPKARGESRRQRWPTKTSQAPLSRALAAALPCPTARHDRQPAHRVIRTGNAPPRQAMPNRPTSAIFLRASSFRRRAS